MSTKQKKIRGRKSWCEGLESINVYRLVKNHNPWLDGLSPIAGPNYISHTCMRKHCQGFCEQIKFISNCSACNDWVQISPFLPLYARYSMYCSQLLSLYRIKMLIFLYFPHMFFDKSKDQTDIVHYGEEKNACRLFRSHSWKHISVWYIWAQPLKS